MKRSTFLLGLLAITMPAFATDYTVIIKHPYYIAGNATASAGTPFAVLAGIISDTTGHRFVARCRIGNSNTTGGNNHFHWQDSMAWQSSQRNTWSGDLGIYYNSRHMAAADSADTTPVWLVSKCDTSALSGPLAQYIIARGRRLITDSTTSSNNLDSPSKQLTVMDMASGGGWLKGHIFGDAGYTTALSNYVVLAYRRDSIVGSYLSENNNIAEGYDSTSAGFIKMAVPAGNIDSLRVRDLNDAPVNFYVKSTPPWTVAAADTIDIDILPNVPTIVFTSPANNAPNVALNAPVRIGFNKVIKQSSFAYACSTGTSGWSAAWNSRSDTVTLTHSNFAYNTIYKFTVTAAQDSGNNNLVPGPRPNPFRFTTQPNPASLPLKIVCLDVGQGDATFIQSPSGKAMLFDGGPSNNQGDTVGIFITDTIGIHHLDYTGVSHYHDDHIGGMDQVIHRLGGRDSVLVAGYDHGGTYASGAFTEYRDTLGAKRQTIALNQVIDLGSGVSVKCVAVNGQTSGDGVTPSDENDRDVSLLISYGGFKMVVSGDLCGYNQGGYKDVESLLAPDIDSVSVLHVNHHGSKFSTNPYWLSVLKPKASIISVGNNGYDHPDTLALNRLMATSTYIYLTEKGSGDTVHTGRGRVVNSNIWITVRPSYFKVAGDSFALAGAPAGVSLGEFTASLLSQGVRLAWRTESEDGCFQWQVERSDDGGASYRAIGSIPGNGTTNDVHQYQYTDGSLTRDGSYQYRLLEIDLSGARTLHGPVTVAFNRAGVAECAMGAAYPNPASRTSSINYQLPQAGRVTFAVYNVLGQQIRMLAHDDRPAGEYFITWDGRNDLGREVPAGIYFFKMQYRSVGPVPDQRSFVKKLLLVR